MTFFDCCGTALKNTKHMIWPFDVGTWFKLFFLMFMTGSCASFPGPVFNGLNDQDTQEKATVTTDTPTLNFPQLPTDKFNWPKLKTFWGDKTTLVITIGASVAAVGFLLLLVFMWLSSRLSFVLLKSLKDGLVQIKKTWGETKELGTSYFAFNVGFLILGLVFMGGLGFLIYNKDVIAIISVVFGAIFLFSLVVVFLRFLPVMMLLTNQKALMSTLLLFDWVRTHFLTAVGYLIGYVLTAWIVTLGAAFVGTILALIVSIPVGGMMFFVVFLAGLLGDVVQAVATGVVVLVGIVVATGVMILFIVPLQTFLTNLRLELVRNA